MTTTHKPRVIPVEMTVDQLVAMRDVFAERHAEQAHYAGKNLAEVEASDSDRWLVRTIKDARRIQEVCSELHAVLTGVPLDPTPEAAPAVVEPETVDA